MFGGLQIIMSDQCNKLMPTSDKYVQLNTHYVQKRTKKTFFRESSQNWWLHSSEYYVIWSLSEKKQCQCRATQLDGQEVIYINSILFPLVPCVLQTYCLQTLIHTQYEDVGKYRRWMDGLYKCLTYPTKYLKLVVCISVCVIVSLSVLSPSTIFRLSFCYK